MGKETLIPYGAMYYLSRLLYRTAKKGVEELLEKEKVKKILGSDEEYQKFLRGREKEKEIMKLLEREED